MQIEQLTHEKGVDASECDSDADEEVRRACGTQFYVGTWRKIGKFDEQSCDRESLPEIRLLFDE